MREKLQAAIGKIVVAGVLIVLIAYIAIYQIWQISERRLGAGLMILVTALCYSFYQWLKPDPDNTNSQTNQPSRPDH